MPSDSGLLCEQIDGFINKTFSIVDLENESHLLKMEYIQFDNLTRTEKHLSRDIYIQFLLNIVNIIIVRIIRIITIARGDSLLVPHDILFQCKDRKGKYIQKIKLPEMRQNRI